jgi:predicted dithiol-disulfide oxidoreductase (DUF899 family)
LTRQRDALLSERQALPWVRVEKEYVFDSLSGKKTLAELFGGNDQLLVYHFMFGPEWEQGCPSCSLAADTMNANVVHLAQRGNAFTAVSRAPIGKIEAFRKRMNWTFPWVSSFGSDFNYDFDVSFTSTPTVGAKVYNYGTAGFPADEAPGASAFHRNEHGEIFHTYSSYGRGLEGLLGVYSLLDMTPRGRNEAGLPFPMAWVRHHDRYEASPQSPECCSAHGD